MGPIGWKYFCDFFSPPLLLPPDLGHFPGAAQFISNEPTDTETDRGAQETQAKWETQETQMKMLGNGHGSDNQGIK